MYGNILNAFVSALVGEHLPVKDIIIHSQDIQYKRPVFMGDKLEAEVKVDGIYESVNAVSFKFSFKNSCPAAMLQPDKVPLKLFRWSFSYARTPYQAFVFFCFTTAPLSGVHLFRVVFCLYCDTKIGQKLKMP